MPAPPGIVICAAGLIGAFFLRASSLPTGLTSNQLFLACCFSLVVSAGYLLVNYRPAVNICVLAFMALTLPGILHVDNTEGILLRWFGWAALMAAVGPLFSDEIRIKHKVLNGTRTILLGLTIGSLVINLMGIRLSGRGLFFGLMGHTMLLAPVSALAAIDLFCRNGRKQSRRNLFLIAACGMTCVGTGSRGAVIGLAAGIFTQVLSRRQGLYVIGLGAIGFVATTLVQLDRGELSEKRGLNGSIYAELADKGTDNTRNELWLARINEFKSSPITGVGFQTQTIFRKHTNRRSLEPGSGYLAILSMTGLIGVLGFLPLCLQIYQSLYTSASSIPSGYRDVLRGWMAFFAVHFIVEGYVFACGSLLCFLFWLTAGCSLSFHHQGRRTAAVRLKQRRAQRRLKAA